MSARLVFPDPLVAQDVLTFAARASRLPESIVRLQAVGGTLAMTAAPLAPRGLLDPTPTVLGLRAVPIDAELVCDLVIASDSLREDPLAAEALVLPEAAVSAPWAGISPPRSGWTEEAAIDASTLASRAQWGIAAVAENMPDNPGEDVVHAVRSRVWAVPDDAIAGLPLGVAFAAFTLGFIAGEERAQLFRAGTWMRLSLTRGHVLVRVPRVAGLTPVRATGTA